MRFWAKKYSISVYVRFTSFVSMKSTAYPRRFPLRVIQSSGLHENASLLWAMIGVTSDGARLGTETRNKDSSTHDNGAWPWAQTGHLFQLTIIIIG